MVVSRCWRRGIVIDGDFGGLSLLSGLLVCALIICYHLLNILTASFGFFQKKSLDVLLGNETYNSLIQPNSTVDGQVAASLSYSSARRCIAVNGYFNEFENCNSLVAFTIANFDPHNKFRLGFIHPLALSKYTERHFIN